MESESKPSRFSFKRLFILVILGAGLCLAAYYVPPYLLKNDEPAPEFVKLGGTSTVFFMMDKWQDAYYKAKGIKFKYDSTGSTHGINEMIDKNYVIGFTHNPLTKKQVERAKERGGAVLQFPVVICAVVPVYNVKELKGKPPLKFTADILADIFSGKITKWDDPALKAINEEKGKDIKLPNTDIKVVHRKDSSGTTAVFSEFLFESKDHWPRELTAGSEIKWPVGEGIERNNGVASLVAQTEGAIGYVDLIHVAPNKLQYGAVKTKDGNNFIHATPENMSAAAQGISAQVPEDLTFNLINKPGENSYPICGAVWAVCYQNQTEANQKIISEFLAWIVHDGQEFAKGRSFAPLPQELIDRVDVRIKLIKVGQQSN